MRGRTLALAGNTKARNVVFQRKSVDSQITGRVEEGKPGMNSLSKKHAKKYLTVKLIS